MNKNLEEVREGAMRLLGVERLSRPEVGEGKEGGLWEIRSER